MKDDKGDTLEYPKVIQSLPFWDTANTYFFDDNYNLNCNGQYNDQGGGKVSLKSAELIMPGLNLPALAAPTWKAPLLGQCTQQTALS